MNRFVLHEMFRDIHRPGEDGIPEFKTYVAGGKWVFGGERLSDVVSPIDGRVIARVSILGKEQVEEAIAAVYEKGREEIRNYPPGEKRVKSFLKAAELMREAFDDFVNVLILDAGKPKGNATGGETKATIERLEKSTFESRRLLGDYVPPGDWSEETLESEA